MRSPCHGDGERADTVAMHWHMHATDDSPPCDRERPLIREWGETVFISRVVVVVSVVVGFGVACIVVGKRPCTRREIFACDS